MKQGRKAVTKVSSKNPSKSSSESSCSTWLSFSVDERKKGPISAEKASKRQKGESSAKLFSIHFPAMLEPQGA